MMEAEIVRPVPWCMLFQGFCTVRVQITANLHYIEAQHFFLPWKSTDKAWMSFTKMSNFVFKKFRNVLANSGELFFLSAFLTYKDTLVFKPHQNLGVL